MRLPRGSALTLISIATGVVAAVAVGTAWFPMVRDREMRALDDQAHQLQLVAALLVDRIMGQVAEGAHPLLDPSLQSPEPPEAKRIAALRASVEPTLQRIAVLADVDRMILVDTRGRLLGAEPGRATASYGDVPADPVLSACDLPKVVDEGHPVRADFRDGDRGRRLAICMPLHDNDDNVLAVLALVGNSEAVLQKSRKRGRDALLLVSVASVAGLIAIVGIRRLLAPLTEVARAAGRIASGERGVRVNVRGSEEMRQLAVAMNALASSVESREDEIGGRMQVVQQLSRVVAHEVRNPLQSLSLLVTLARTEPDATSRDKQLQLIEEEIHVLAGVVQRFLSQSGPLRVARSQTDLVDILERAAAIAYPKAAATNVRLRLHTAGRMPVVADGSLVRRALENLILNAIEAAGGKDRDGQVNVSLVAREHDILVVVDDNGPGVPPEHRERIFEADVSTKPGGTGLGLALVRQVFKAHDGSIRCEDSPLGGARFVASLPNQA